MKARAAALFFSCMSAQYLFAQPAVDTALLTAKLKKDSARIYRPRPVQLLLSLDQRNTFWETSASRNTPVDMQGVKVGLKLHSRHRGGVGIYRITDARSQKAKREAGEPVEVSFRFNYLTVFYEYYFIHTRKWDVGLPLEAGIGRYKALEIQNDNNEGLLYPLGLGVSGHYKPHRWGALNVMGGYRLVANNSDPLKLSNWFYAFGISLNTRNLYDDARYAYRKRWYRRQLAHIGKISG